MRTLVSLKPTAPSRIDEMVRELADFEAMRTRLAARLARSEDDLATGQARRRVVADRLAMLKREGRNQECSEVNRELNTLDMGPQVVGLQTLRAEIASLDQSIGNLRREITRTPCV